jgi:hypothetical protein
VIVRIRNIGHTIAIAFDGSHRWPSSLVANSATRPSRQILSTLKVDFPWVSLCNCACVGREKSEAENFSLVDGAQQAHPDKGIGNHRRYTNSSPQATKRIRGLEICVSNHSSTKNNFASHNSSRPAANPDEISEGTPALSRLSCRVQRRPDGTDMLCFFPPRSGSKFCSCICIQCALTAKQRISILDSFAYKLYWIDQLCSPTAAAAASHIQKRCPPGASRDTLPSRARLPQVGACRLSGLACRLKTAGRGENKTAQTPRAC